MTVSLEESVNGVEKRVRLPTGKELNVKIPAGVAAGQQIRLKGQGETAPGHRPGDLLITVSVAPHPFFKVDGSDLRLDLPITLYEAVLGGKVRVPTLGSAVELSIPKNTSSGMFFLQINLDFIGKVAFRSTDDAKQTSIFTGLWKFIIHGIPFLPIYFDTFKQHHLLDVLPDEL